MSFIVLCLYAAPPCASGVRLIRSQKKKLRMPIFLLVCSDRVVKPTRADRTAPLLRPAHVPPDLGETLDETRLRQQI